MGAAHSNTRHPQQAFEGRGIDLDRKFFQMIERPVAFGVKQWVEAGILFVKQLLRREPVIAEQPVGLIEPVLPQKRRLDLQRRQQGIGYKRDIGREKDSFELVFAVERLG